MKLKLMIFRVVLLPAIVAGFVTQVNATDIHDAAESGQLEQLRDFLQDPGTDINATDDLGWTPLMWAAWEGRKEIVELLLQAGADITATDNGGDTALTLAEKQDQSRIVTLIEEYLITNQRFTKTKSARNWAL